MQNMQNITATTFYNIIINIIINNSDFNTFGWPLPFSLIDIQSQHKRA